MSKQQSYGYDKQHQDDVEAEVIGALSASETFLSHARDEAYSMPNFRVSDSTLIYWLPQEIEIDNNSQKGGRDGKAIVDYTIFGNLDNVEIDRDGDGHIDSTIQNRRNIFGWSKGMDFDMNADGEIDAKAKLWWSGFPWRRIRNMEYYQDGEYAGKAGIWYGLRGVSSIEIDSNLDGKADHSAAVRRGLFSPMNSFGPEQV